MMRADRAATALLLLVGALALVIGAFDVLSVAYADQHLGTSAAGAGLLVGALGIGALFGAAVSVMLIRWRRLFLAVAAGLVTTGLPLMVMSLPRALAPAVVLLAAAGLGKSFFDIARRTLLQRTVEAGMLARVFGLAEAVKLTGIAVGAAGAPVLVAALTASGAYLPLGAALAALAVLMLRPLRVLDLRSSFRPDVVALLWDVPFLAVLDVPTLEGLAHAAVEIAVPAGTVVIQEGHRGDRFYLVAEGRLAASISGAAPVVMAAGEHFGEIALLRSVRRTATVTALTDSRVWALDREVFLAAVTRSSRSSELAEDATARRLHRMAPERLRPEDGAPEPGTPEADAPDDPE